MLESLATIIPGIITLEVGIDISLTEMSGDIVLYSEFESKDALDNYQLHPEHKKISPLILEARQERRIVDYVV